MRRWWGLGGEAGAVAAEPVWGVPGKGELLCGSWGVDAPTVRLRRRGGGLTSLVILRERFPSEDMLMKRSVLKV